MPKKSAAQLQREIDEALRNASSLKIGDAVQFRSEPGTGGVIRRFESNGWARVATPRGERTVPTYALVLVREEHEPRVRRSVSALRSHATMKSRAKPKSKLHSPITDDQAAEIASAWHSVMTWSDPGVAMYSVSSTGKIHSEKHRKQLLAYIATSIPQAQKLDDQGEAGIVTESNVADLEALRDWAKAFPLKKQR